MIFPVPAKLHGDAYLMPKDLSLLQIRLNQKAQFDIDKIRSPTFAAAKLHIMQIDRVQATQSDTDLSLGLNLICIHFRFEQSHSCQLFARRM